MQTLLEIRRNQYINDTKQSDLYVDQSQGKNRYFRRMKQIVQKSTDKLNHIEMDKLFRHGILDVNLDVNGETDSYVVRISFGKFLYHLRKLANGDENNFTLRTVTRALVNAYDDDDVFVRCTCPDFIYRQAYHLSMNGGIAGEMETRPSNVTNPDDTKGHSCKHINAVLTNSSWLQRVARCVYNYVNYIKQHYFDAYANKIYPAVFEKDYDEIYQQSLDLTSDEFKNSPVDTANKWAREKDKFKSGNQSGWQFSKNDENSDDIDGQLSLQFDEPQKQFDVDSIDTDEQ